MAEPKLSIKFEGIGVEKLRLQINQLHIANKGLLHGQKAAEKLQARMIKQNAVYGASVDKINAKTRNLQGTFSVLRSKLLLFSFGMMMAVEPMKRFVKASSDKNEILNKSTVVFGDNISAVREWANALGDSVGRAESTLLEMASSLQDLFVPMGYTRETAAHLSTSLTKLAIDVASFSNKVDKDVLQDFQSALVGNHKTVRKYGIVITEATLKQEAYNMGLSSTFRELSENEKVQARISLINKGSADAMGDAERTAHEYAQSMVRFNEVWKETAEAVGEALKPLMAAMLRFASDPQNIRSFGIALGGVALAFTAIKLQAWLASMSVETFNKAVKRSVVGVFAIALGYAVDAFLRWKLATDDETKSLAEHEAQLSANSDATEGYIGVNEKLTALQSKSAENLQVKAQLLDLEVRKVKALTEGAKFALAIEQRMIEVSKGREGGLESLTQAEINLIHSIETKTLALQIARREDKKQEAMYDKAYSKKRQQTLDEIANQKLLVEQLKRSLENQTSSIKNSGVVKEQELQKSLNLAVKEGKKLKKMENDLGSFTTVETNLSNQRTHLANKESELEALLEKKWFKGKYRKRKSLEKQIEVAKLGVTTAEERYKQGSVITQAEIDDQKKIVKALAKKNATLLTGLSVDEELTDTQKKMNKEIEDATDKLNNMTTAYENLGEKATGVSKKMFKLDQLGQFSSAFQSTMGDMGINFFDTMDGMQGAYDQHFEQFEDKGEAMNAAYTEMGMQLGAALVDQHLQSIEAQMASIKQAGKTKLDEEKKTRKWEKMSANQKKEREKEILADTQKQLNKEFEGKKQAAAVGVLMDTATAIMKTIAASPLTVGMPWSAIAGAMGAAQLAMVLSQKPPKAALGGRVGGSPPSQGGTMIEAERGEFIMSRDAVDSVGVENMNRINMGGGGGGVNVSFSGNINSDDFIESEAIPKIKEAIRRGADIGAA